MSAPSALAAVWPEVVAVARPEPETEAELDEEVVAAALEEALEQEAEARAEAVLEASLEPETPADPYRRRRHLYFHITVGEFARSEHIRPGLLVQ